ncbi:sigma-70 family RNA polymerase sigma factor [Glycomyces harbinensis]|uniref:sigma-70 family RNA polymerase sigma factor n=1 Tax=Glycomyces harbinensis TaxID=58114 RepID=UPI000B86A926|nr:sigma-70 family RNA polymerase sigma factor [Glycomyces harbinensis]
MERLSGPSPTRGPETGPSTPGSPETQPPTAYPPTLPRALEKRLSPAEREGLIAAFNADARQKELATKYGISIRSIKRLVQGTSNRPQAAANRLSPDQQAAVIRTYTTGGITQAELASQYGVAISTIKRLLRLTQSSEPGDTFA